MPCQTATSPHAPNLHTCLLVHFVVLLPGSIQLSLILRHDSLGGGHSVMRHLPRRLLHCLCSRRGGVGSGSDNRTGRRSTWHLSMRRRKYGGPAQWRDFCVQALLCDAALQGNVCTGTQSHLLARALVRQGLPQLADLALRLLYRLVGLGWSCGRAAGQTVSSALLQRTSAG